MTPELIELLRMRWQRVRIAQPRAEGNAPYAARHRELFWLVLCRPRWHTGTSKRSAPRVSGATTGGTLCLRTYGAVS